MDGTISYGGNSLQTYNYSTGIGIITDDIDLDGLADANIDVYPLAHYDLSKVAGADVPSKTIPVTGTIKSDTAAHLDTLLDTFRGYFQPRRTLRNLDIGYNGATRRYVAIAYSLSITRSANKKYAKFAIQFLCTPPYGKETTSTTALNATGRTAATYTDAYTFLGSAPTQHPIITITLTAVSATGSQQLYWGDDSTGQGIVLTRNNWTAGDVIVIDTRDGGSVTVNGVAADFSGAFPEMAPGAHNMTYSDTFTSRTMTENVIYYKRYA